jgi:hypothetical protein
MATRKTEVEDTRTQRQKFIDAAREHGASQDADAFRRALQGRDGARHEAQEGFAKIQK